MEVNLIPVMLLGHGGIGRHHARLLRQNPQVHFLGVVDPTLPELPERVVSQWCDLGEIQHPWCAAIVATPILTHYALVKDLLLAGWNVFVEKPLAWNLAEAQELKTLAEQQNRVLFVGHSEGHNPAFIRFLELFRQGITGEVYRVECNRSGPYPQKQGEYGATIDLAVHDLEALAHLLENDSPAWFFGNAEQRIHPTQEDGLNAMMRFRSGVLATLTVNWLSPRKTRTFNVFGKMGMLQCDFYLRQVTFFENRYQRSRPDEYGIGGIEEGEVQNYSVADWEPLAHEHQDFFRMVHQQQTDILALQRAMTAVDWANLLLESSRLNRPVEALK